MSYASAPPPYNPGVPPQGNAGVGFEHHQQAGAGSYQPPPYPYQTPYNAPYPQQQQGYHQPYGYPQQVYTQQPNTVYVYDDQQRRRNNDDAAECFLWGLCAACLCCCLLDG